MLHGILESLQTASIQENENKYDSMAAFQPANCQIVITARCQLVTPAAYYNKCLVDISVVDG